MDLRPSRLTTDRDGWTWLAATSRGARLRQAFWSVVLSLLLIGVAAAATLPPPVYAVPLVALVVGVGGWLARTLWSRAHSAVAVSPLGIAVRSGFDVAQVGWPAVRAVVAEPTGRRVRIVIESSGGRYRTAASFTPTAARAWLEACTEHARRRHLCPEPLEGIDGFQAG